LKIAVAVASIVVMSGCAKTTKVELLRSKDTVQYCYKDAANEVESRIKSLLNECFRASSTSTMTVVNGVFIPMTFDHHWNIYEDITQLGHVYSVELESAALNTFVLAAEVSKADGACDSTLRLYARNKRWSETSFESINRSILEKAVICPVNLKK
jgi:hypothetical protein